MPVLSADRLKRECGRSTLVSLIQRTGSERQNLASPIFVIQISIVVHKTSMKVRKTASISYYHNPIIDVVISNVATYITCVAALMA